MRTLVVGVVGRNGLFEFDISPDKAEQMSGACHAMGSAQPIENMKPSCGKFAVRYGVAHRGQPDTYGIRNLATTDLVANQLYRGVMNAIHAIWIVPFFMECQLSRTVSFQFFWSSPTNYS